MPDETSDRSRRWAATMGGHAALGGLTVAHRDSRAPLSPTTRDGGPAPVTREAREALAAATLASGAALPSGAGRRARDEEPDPYRTCFERDRDRVLHSAAFRRLAGKTQVFIFPEDHMRTRLTHALEVAQVATGMSRALGLDAALAEAIALGHDCGHGPGGHASEHALDPYVAGGFDHAVWGADVSLAPLNLCAETLDGVRNHSWSRPAPATAEGEVVSWADRVAYVCHDFEDAVAAGIVAAGDLPAGVRALGGERRGGQLGAFITALVATSREAGAVGMDGAHAAALAEFRDFNYRAIYMRPASRDQAARVVDMLRALVEHVAERPELIPDVAERGLSGDATAAAVGYVAGMTDRFACRAATTLLAWPAERLPSGVDR